jgi:hypothetical protein
MEILPTLTVDPEIHTTVTEILLRVTVDQEILLTVTADRDREILLCRH